VCARGSNWALLGAPSTPLLGGMNERRRDIDTQLKKLTVPLLRQQGFKGSYPRFYRDIDGHVDLLMFQFRSDGSSFIVEISYADPDRRNVYFRPETPVNRLQVPATSKRHRLGGPTREVDAEWLKLDHGPWTTQARHFSKLALRVNDLLLTEAEPWWTANRHAT
jgi:hypothetical protein